MHSRARGTMHHQTSKMGTQQQVVRKQVLCAVHGKELDLVCTHDSHPPQMVCISCVGISPSLHRLFFVSLFFFPIFFYFLFVFFFFASRVNNYVIVTTHQSHPCVTTADYFNGKQADLRALLERAKASEDRLAQGVEVVGKEQLSIVENRDSVRSSLNSLFTKVFHILRLLTSLTHSLAHRYAANWMLNKTRCSLNSILQQIVKG